MNTKTQGRQWDWVDPRQTIEMGEDEVADLHRWMEEKGVACWEMACNATTQQQPQKNIEHNQPLPKSQNTSSDGKLLAWPTFLQTSA